MTDFRINVIINPGPAVAGAKGVEAQLRRTQGAADSLRATLFRTFAAVGVTAGVVGSIRLLAEYSQAMSTVKAVTQATAAQFAALDQRAQELGRNTRFTATEAATGMVLLARSGFTAEEALTAVEGTLKLAQAGAIDLASAASIASNALRGFRLNVNETGRVVDVLATAANASNTDIQQLGDALKFVAPIAAGLGVSIEETTAAIGKLSDSGLQASLAGTGLRRVLSELESPAGKTVKILSDIGVTTDQVKISQVGLTAALKALADAGLDTGQALEVFGDRGGPAFEVLSSALPGVVALTEKLRNAAGTANRVAEVMDDNLNGALLRVKSAFEGLIIAAGASGGFNVLTSSANGLAVALNAMTDNIEAVGAAITILGVGLILLKTSLVVTLVAAEAATLAYLRQAAASTLLAVSLGGLRGAALAAAGALRAASLGGATIGGPFVLLIAGAALAFVAISKLIEHIKEYTAALKIAEGGELGGLSDFGKAGAQIQRLTKLIEGYDARLKAGTLTQEQYDTVTKNLVKRIEGYRAEQDRLSGATDRARAAAALLVEEQDSLNAAYERSLKSLADDERLLGLGNSEREVQAALLKEIAAIQKEGGPELTNQQIENLTALIQSNQALSDQADAFDRIKGPQEEFTRGLQALQTLLNDNRITVDEFNKAVVDLAADAEGVDLSGIKLPDGSNIESQLAQIEALAKAQQELARQEALRDSVLRDVAGPEAELLERKAILISLLGDETVNQERLAEALSKVEAALNPLTEEQQRLKDLLEQITGPEEQRQQRLQDLSTLLASGSLTLAQYNAELERLGANVQAELPLAERITQLNQQFASGELTQQQYIDELQRLEQFAGPSEAFLTGLDTLNQKLAAGTITAQQFLAEFAKLGQQAENPVVTFADGVDDALTKIGAKAKTTGEITSDALVNGFDAAADALANFATTGKLDFADLARSILGDLAKILAQQLLLQALTGAGIPLPGVTGNASGGDFEANKSMLVGEKGPELVRFGSPGNITPADQTARALAATGAGGGGGTTVNVAPAQVKLQVINVDSPDAARDAMDSAEGGKVIMNQIRANREAVRRELG